MSEQSDERDALELTKRQFIGATIGAGVLGSSSIVRSAAGDGGNGGGGGNGRGVDDIDPSEPEHSVTLLTGHTVVVSERERQFDDEGSPGQQGVERSYAVVGGDPGGYQLVEDPTGTYFVPDSVDLERVDRELFNVDYLVDHGYTDDQLDSIPVIASLPDEDGAVRTTGVSTHGSGTREFESINAVATNIPKRSVETTDVADITTGIEFLHLDKTAEAALDESTARIDVPTARERFDVDGSGVRVAVIDTGIDSDHPDLADRLVYEADYTRRGVADNNGHGTHVAGIAAGDGAVSDGEYVGVAPGADLMNVKALDGSGRGRYSNIIAAVEDAVDNDADVINMSIGGPTSPDDPLVAAVNWAREQGVVTTAAAGNELGTAAFRTVNSPAAAAGAIAVGASDDGDGRRGPSLASARGPTDHTFLVKPEVSAPGVDITAAGSQDADQDPYADKTGTSMAAPHVAGLAALLLEIDPDRTPDAIEDTLVSTATFEAGRDVYKQGGGEVDAVDALETDLRIHDAVLNWGLMSEAVVDTRSITVENLGSESKTIDVSATLRNEFEETDLDDHVEVDPGTLELEPGATATVDLTVDTEDVFGMAAGMVTFDDGAKEQQAIFGFTRGLDLTIEKTVHEDRSDAAGDIGWLWSDDGRSSIIAQGFDAEGVWRPLLFRTEATLTVWSIASLPPDRDRGQSDAGEPVMTIASDVHVDPDNKHVHLDETETVPRTIDTSPLEDAPTHEAFDDSDFTAILHGVTGPRRANRVFGRALSGTYNVFTAHVSPVETEAPTNISTEWVFYPTHDRDFHYDVDDVYWLYEPTTSIPDSGDTIEVRPETLAAEEFTYHRTSDDELLSVYPIIFPADTRTYPMPFSFAYLRRIGHDREEQTWWRSTADARYADSWQDTDRVRTRSWTASRQSGFVPPDAGTYTTAFNRAPPMQTVDDYFGTIVDPDRIFQWMELADQPPEAIEFNPDWSAISGGYEVLHQGTVIAEDATAGPAPQSPVDVESVPDLDADDTVTIRWDARDESRSPAVEFKSDYEVQYDPNGGNRPPELESISLPFLDSTNQIPAGEAIVWVDVTPAQSLENPDFNPPEEIVDFEAYYSDGSARRTPFEDGANWQDATIVARDGNRFAIHVEAAGGALDLAIGTANDADNVLRSTMLRAAGVTDPPVLLTVDTDTLELGSNQTVPVVIERTADLDPHTEIDVDSLRFGAPTAIDAGEGATPIRHQQLGNGDLRVHFPADETGYEDDRSPVTAVLAGHLTDGATIYGSDVFDAVTIRGNAPTIGN